MTDLGNGPVVVTGGAGFLGRQVVEQLAESGFTDIVVPRRADCDLTDQRATWELIEQTRPGLLVHLAAEVGGIGVNQANPGRFFYANAQMGINLIEASRAYGVAKFVQIGTVCSYPKYTAVPFSETELWNGFPEETNAPYGIAKRALLAMLHAYRTQYGFNGIYLLPANLYGPDDNFDPQTSHVIPALIRKFVEAADAGASSVTLWGTGSASREFLHVRDAARGIVEAALAYNEPEPVNLGTGSEITIAALADLVSDLTGFSGGIVWDATKPDGQPRRSLDTSRAAQAFGFSATTPLEDGLRETIRWWKENRSVS